MSGRARRLLLALASCATVAATGLGAAGATGVPAHRTSPAERAREIAAQAYLYGIAPLDEWRVISNFPANLLIDVTRPSTPAQRLVPLPNVDTLYTTARLVLTAGPLVLHVPEEHRRYYALQLLDAYTNTFGYIGRRVSGTHAGSFAIVGPGWHGRLPPATPEIRSPTPVVWLLGRTLLEGPRDLPRAQAIQRRYTLSTLSGQALGSVSLPGSTLRPPPLPRGLAFLDALGSELAQNPPPTSSEQALLRRFASVGIGAGRAPSGESLTPAVRRGLLGGLRDGQRELARLSSLLALRSERRHGGWVLPPAGVGAYGRDYDLRAYIAQNALGANVPAEAIYPVTAVDHALAPLSGRHRYLLRFAPGQRPPVDAFWSLTMYDRRLFLVSNSTGRYAVGNRTPGLRLGRDGSLTIVIAHRPPRSRVNWLPAPAGRFVLALRLYQPRRSVLEGRWPLPRISRLG